MLHLSNRLLDGKMGNVLSSDNSKCWLKKKTRGEYWHVLLKGKLSQLAHGSSIATIALHQKPVALHFFSHRL
jgi:hypothetical protein